MVAVGALACSSPDSARQEPTAGQQQGAAAQQPGAPQQPAGMAHGNHDPHHGGLVMMDRDLHFEVVLRQDTEYRVYFTDEARKPLPASTVQDVIVTVSCEDSAPETVGLQVDEKDESWVGRLQHAVHDAEATVRVSYVYRDVPYWIDIPIQGLRNPPATGGEHPAPGSGTQHE
jgi:hypothetical protein